MTDCTKLRAAISGLVGLAAEEEVILLVEARPTAAAVSRAPSEGSPGRLARCPVPDRGRYR